MPLEPEWVTLYHPGQQATHRVPDHSAVIQDFRDRGWETEADTDARLSAEHEPGEPETPLEPEAPDAPQTTTTEETEGEQG